MELVDTHCHLHFDAYQNDVEQVIKGAAAAGVARMICVGTTLEDSKKAIEFAERRENIWATVGVHPHDADSFLKLPDAGKNFREILDTSSILAVGEIGLDYFKLYSSKEAQQKALRLQIETGLPSGLPFIFHVRDAWEDFWQILSDYPAIKGVVHSFSAHPLQLEQVLSRGLYVGLNGIMTFTRDTGQLEAAKKAPRDRLLLETDAPFLAPAPYRGQRCEPKHIKDVAEFLAELRGETFEALAKSTSKNAEDLFRLR